MAGDPLEALAVAVKRRRLALVLSVDAAAAAGKLAAGTWSRVERGEPVRPLSLAGLDAALGWPAGSAAAVLDGGQPPADELPRPATSRDVAQLVEVVEGLDVEDRARVLGFATGLRSARV